jgi:hypothetical protein
MYNYCMIIDNRMNIIHDDEDDPDDMMIVYDIKFDDHTTDIIIKPSTLLHHRGVQYCMIAASCS